MGSAREDASEHYWFKAINNYYAMFSYRCTHPFANLVSHDNIMLPNNIASQLLHVQDKCSIEYTCSFVMSFMCTCVENTIFFRHQDQMLACAVHTQIHFQCIITNTP